MKIMIVVLIICWFCIAADQTSNMVSKNADDLDRWFAFSYLCLLLSTIYVLVTALFA